MVTKTWVSFIKIHLQSPHKDDNVSLKREHAIRTEMEDGEKMIGKVGKGWAHHQSKKPPPSPKGDMLQDNYSNTILQEIVMESYYTGKQLNFLSWQN